jgi:ATP-dependent Zn protease
MSRVFLEFLWSWGPMILLIGVWIYFMRKSGSMKYQSHVQDMIRIAEAQLHEMRATNERLARVETLLAKLPSESNQK